MLCDRTIHYLTSLYTPPILCCDFNVAGDRSDLNYTLFLVQELQDGLVWVAEQIPGLTLAKDVTQTLERGYWPSYNVPYFREVKHYLRPEINCQNHC